MVNSQFNDLFRQDFLLESGVMEILADINETLRRDIGFNLTDFMHECSFKNQPCDER